MQNFHDFHSGDPEGDVGEQLAEEAVDHRDDDDARPAALRHQLRHVLLHLHLLHRRPKYVSWKAFESRDSTISNSRSDPSQSQSATLGMGAMNVAMTFVSLALIGELMVMMMYPPSIHLNSHHTTVISSWSHPHQRKRWWWVDGDDLPSSNHLNSHHITVISSWSYPHQRKRGERCWWSPDSVSCCAWQFFSSPVSLLLWVSITYPVTSIVMMTFSYRKKFQPCPMWLSWRSSPL